MSKVFKSTAGKLPKSVKVRSTCNSCQQAKIRCSHEKPSCRRCQKHKISCIYSISRRLGRPAKEKDPGVRVDDQRSSSSPDMVLQQEHTKETRNTTKSKGHRQSATSGTQPRGVRAPVKTADDKFMSSIDMKKNEEELSALEVDFASETWLQELMSSRMNWSVGNFALQHPHQMDSLDTSHGYSECIGQVGSSVYQAADLLLMSPLMGQDPVMVHGGFDGDSNTFHHSVPDGQLGIPVGSEPSNISWAYDSNTALDGCVLSDSWTINKVPSTSFLFEPTIDYHPFESPNPSRDCEELSPAPQEYVDESQYLSCSCYNQTIGELFRSSTKADWRGLSSIDSILACQKELLMHTEAILQCKWCSQSEAQINLLMVVIVTIDSLLTSLDAAAPLYNPGAEEELSAMWSEDRRRVPIDVSEGFKSYKKVCPLLVGEFRVPTDDKMIFIRQLLHARLSMLMMMIRRIRTCMQQHLASALSRGRFLMIMETDRRLQLIMMKVKIAAV
ncbi:hypothetical protein N7523_001045 [Penicillium sp. IBT 18751x]|nr:hypothetical protein N7523_001045 [Penicillium sp. IBT 18751x]